MTTLLFEVGQHFAPEQLDGVPHLRHRAGHEQHAGPRRGAGPRVGADALRNLLGAADEVALVEATGLLAQRRALERLEMLEELRRLESSHRLVVGPADRDGELWRDVDRGAVALDGRSGAVDIVDTPRELVG